MAVRPSGGCPEPQRGSTTGIEGEKLGRVLTGRAHQSVRTGHLECITCPNQPLCQTAHTLNATSAKQPSQTAPGVSLRGLPNFRVFNTWFCSWGPRLDIGQNFRGVSRLFPCVNVGRKPIYWPLKTSHTLRCCLPKISLEYKPLHHIITDDISFAHFLHRLCDV